MACDVVAGTGAALFLPEMPCMNLMGSSASWNFQTVCKQVLVETGQSREQLEVFPSLGWALEEWNTYLIGEGAGGIQWWGGGPWPEHTSSSHSLSSPFGGLTLARCQMPTKPLSYSPSSAGQGERRIYQKSLWVKIKAWTSLTRYRHGQNRLNSGKLI